MKKIRESGRVKSATKAEVDLLKQKITEKAEKSPRKAALVLTNWIKQPSKRRRKKAA